MHVTRKIGAVEADGIVGDLTSRDALDEIPHFIIVGLIGKGPKQQRFEIVPRSRRWNCIGAEVLRNSLVFPMLFF